MSLQLDFQPDKWLIRSLRTFVANFCEHALHDPEIASRVEVAAHELAENAAKHSTDRSVVVGVSVEGGRVRMSFSNLAPRAQLNELTARFAAMKRFPDPISYYVSLMHTAAENTEGSGLGLARVLAEARMTLALEVNGDRATIWAETKISGSTP